MHLFLAAVWMLHLDRHQTQSFSPSPMHTTKRQKEKLDTFFASSASAYNDNLNNETSDWVEAEAKIVGDWELMHGNFLLRPPKDNPPRALIHFLGGAIVGKAPHITYRYLLERLASQGYLIVATPYDLSFDYLTTCDAVITRFERVAAMIARQYGGLPVVGLGHSCGSLLQVLITSLFPDTPRGANALLSFNNKPVDEAVPLFEQIVAPFFTYVAGRDGGSNASNKKVSGNDVIRLGLDLARSATLGKVPPDSVLSQALKLLPRPPQSGDPTTTVEVPESVRSALEALAQPPSQALSQAGLVPLCVEFLETMDQIPSLIDEVAEGARDFEPPPSALKAAAQRSYRARRTLILGYTEDPIDESDDMEELLQVAGQVIRMKRPMVQIDVQRRNLPGGHATPLLAPPLDLAQQLEDLLGESTAKEQLAYSAADDTVNELIQWLEESEL